MEVIVTYVSVTITEPFLRGCGITGKDLLKKQQPVLPEAMGLVAGCVLCTFLPYGPILWCTLCGLWIGALDDIFDVKWRTKLILSALSYLPLIQSNTNILLFGNLLDLGVLYHVYMIIWCVWCGNAINIHAGINGLEVGQCVVIAMGLFVVTTGPFYSYICVAAVLLFYNWYPAQLFVGDSWCYLSGMFFVASAQHDTELLAIMMLPQIINTLLSLPELIGECPRHRMPKYDVQEDVLLPSGNGTLLNVILNLCGPMHERRLCQIALCLQAICVCIGVYVKS